MEDRAKKIIEACMQEKGKSPVDIFCNVAKQEFIRIHGPEHHILDGAALLTSFYNAGGNINLPESLNELMKRGLQMPGATCGMWGVCGAVSSMGAALSIMDGTGPLSMDSSWGKHMEFTSAALGSLAQVGGPRCCKRDAFLSFQKAIEYVNENYDVELENSRIACDFSAQNEQCIKERCPFYKSAKKQVAFTCVHNSCRSQIAEALGKHLASDVFESYSAGTENKLQINQDAVRIMRELFVLDKKNYDSNGSVGRRPSVRGIILRDGKIAMMHSLKYNYYKLPGGGIEGDESLEETLVREVREESGLIVKPETIEEFGYVRRIEKGKIEEIFIQDNYYFTCDVESTVASQELDDYEAEEQFVLEFVETEHAICVNESANHLEKSEIVTFQGMLDRENRVLRIVEQVLLQK